MSEKYVATDVIYMGTARAANPGDQIPAAHPKRAEWVKAGLVERVSEKSEEKDDKKS